MDRIHEVYSAESPSSDSPLESPCSRVASQSTAALIQPLEPPRSSPAGEPPRSVDTALRLGARSRLLQLDRPVKKRAAQSAQQLVAEPAQSVQRSTDSPAT